MGVNYTDWDTHSGVGQAISGSSVRGLDGNESIADGGGHAGEGHGRGEESSDLHFELV